MSVMTESIFWKDIKKHSPYVAWNRLENMVGAGMFDVYGTRHGKSVWVELKIIHSGKVTVRHSQYAWFQKRWAQQMADMLFLARDKNTIQGWRADHLLNPERIAQSKVTDSGLVIPVPTPNFLSNKPFDWEGLENWLFMSR